MDISRKTLIWPALASVMVALEGCGGGSKPVPPPVGPPLDDHLASDPQPECPESMRSTLQELVDKYARRYGVSISAAFVGPQRSEASSSQTGEEAECSMGYTSPGPEGACRNGCDRRAVPQGSFTKLWTASAVMKLYEEGKLDLDDNAFPFLDGAYRHGGGNFSLAEKFGEHIRKVTVRQLLSMRASIADFNEQEYQLKHPLEDLSPARLVDKYGSGTGQPVGTCGAYSSMGYTLLGMLLINVSGSSSWADYNQNVWHKQFPDIDFGVLGPCRNYTDVSGKQFGRDFLDISCTAGYSCGNMVARPISVAAFVKALFEGELLKKQTVEEMLAYQKLGEGCDSGRIWGQGAPYGLGVMGNPLQFQGDALQSRIPGHRGSTYGYVSIAAYDTEAKASISVAAGGMLNSPKLALWKDIHKAFLDRWPLHEGLEDSQDATIAV